MTQWTREQQQVIDTREKNMLVAAAAGSGKTAVLVERIIQMVLDENHPVDVDKIVVVTFTRAAAAEMRERILSAIEKKLQEQPTNAHLLKQATLVHSAFITTIDSFCNYIVRNYFYEIDMDPGFRIGDQGEMKLLQAAVMDKFLEQQYQQAKGEKDSVFLQLVDSYGKGNTDASIADMIQEIYEKAQSFPWPMEWIEQLREPYTITTEEELAHSPWFVWVMEVVEKTLLEAIEETKRLMELCQTPMGPDCYLEGLQQDVEHYEDVLVFQDASRKYEAFRECRWRTIGRKPKNYEKDEVLLEQVKDRRDALKKKISDMQKDFCGESLPQVVAQMQAQRPLVEECVRLAKEYTQAFAKEKRKKNIVDFSDVEHFALEILKDKHTHELRPTAISLQQQFQEIMIDEYQDSNYIQEEILTSISKESCGCHNMFMVGDIKQSIYRFRQACPDIFMGKYQGYKDGTKEGLAIDLQKNFRSRIEVLDFANDVCTPLMKKDLGDVEYDEAARLNLGAEMYPVQEQMFLPEIILGDSSQVEDPVAYEAKMIADKILDLKKHQLVFDKETNGMRAMRFSDVVILMRSPNKLADTIISVLKENNIPAFAESRTGYFDAVEVELVLDLLRIIDNPYQDIPLAAVLHSPMFSFSNDALAQIHQKNTSLLDSLLQYQEQSPEDEKVNGFLSFLQTQRSLAKDLTVHQLIEQVLQETGYLNYVSAMPRGENRRANLEKLMDQAVVYEKTSYRGLFHFVHYIERLKKYQIDMGEAALISENDDAVSIMSIHKSKGLEFPVVILAGLGRKFNLTDAAGSMLLHSDLGIGLDEIQIDQQIKGDTLYKKAIAKRTKWDTFGEEMRVLYVALTRAKEKMILMGTCKNLERALQQWDEPRERLSLGAREGAYCFMEWILRATATKRGQYPVQQITPEDVIQQEVEHQVEQTKKADLLQFVKLEKENPWQLFLQQQLEYVYPFQTKQELKNKYSVSEIKHQRMEEHFLHQQDEAQPVFLEKTTEATVPQFISKKEKQEASLGALKGTAMHRFLECCSFDTEQSVVQQADIMCHKGLLTMQQRQWIDIEKQEGFFASSLGQRMRAAEQKDLLYKEMPFVMQVTPGELFPEKKEVQEQILLQGIIDAYFEEEEGIVVLDYKTDGVKKAEELLQRYEIQLQLYGKALARSRNLPIKEILIYSFALEEIISIKPLQC